MPDIYQITVRRAELLESTAEGYRLFLEWDVCQSPGEPYTGSFYAHLYSDGIFQKCKLIVISATGQGCVALLPYVQGKATLRISAGQEPESTASYPDIPILQERYTAIKGEFDGTTLSLIWGGTTELGELTLSPLNHTLPLQRFPLLGTATTLIPVGQPEGGWKAVFRNRLEDPEQAWLSLGATTEILLCTASPTIKTVDIDGTEITVTYTLPKAWDNVKIVQTACCALLRDKTEHYRWAVQTPEKVGDVYQIKFVTPNEGIQNRLSTYTLAAYCGGANSLCTAGNPLGQIPLMPPTVETEITKEGTAVLRWDLPNPEDGFVVSVNGMETQTIYQRECSYALNLVLEQTARVAALYGSQQCRGPFSSPVNFRKEGFFPDTISGVLRYRGSTEGTCCVTLPGSLFKSPLEEPLIHNPFCVEEVDGLSKLTLTLDGDFSYSQLETFMKSLFDHHVTPAGYYCIREALTRLSPVPTTELLRYCCAAQKNGLSLDILPGFLLKTETAYYNRQTSSTVSDNNGFIRGAVGEYPITLAGDVLEMDSLFQYTVGSWTDGGQPIYPRPAAGLSDFFFAPLRSAYYRLCFPKSFPDSSSPGTLHSSDNICLMALRPCDPTPQGLIRANQPALMLRGRTSVTVHINVLVNNSTVSIPLGTTLSSLLARYGTDTRSASLFRQGPSKPIPVFLGTTTPETAGKLFLLPGDRIEV